MQLGFFANVYIRKLLIVNLRHRLKKTKYLKCFLLGEIKTTIFELNVEIQPYYFNYSVYPQKILRHFTNAYEV